jgi:hypothetical protein
MLTVTGTIQNGMIQPSEPLVGQDGRTVVVLLAETDTPTPAQLLQAIQALLALYTTNQPVVQPSQDESWSDLMAFLDRHAIDTGIDDLAHQHDHYLHNTPKREPYCLP